MGAQVVRTRSARPSCCLPPRAAATSVAAAVSRAEERTSTACEALGKPWQICDGFDASFAQTRPVFFAFSRLPLDRHRQMDDSLPPLGVAEVLPVVGMLLAIAIAILYGCGCLGSVSSPSARPAPGSGSKGFVRNPEGFQDDDDDEDSEDEKDR